MIQNDLDLQARAEASVFIEVGKVFPGLLLSDICCWHGTHQDETVLKVSIGSYFEATLRGSSPRDIKDLKAKGSEHVGYWLKGIAIYVRMKWEEWLAESGERP